MCILGIYRSVFPHHFQGFHRSIKSNVFDDLSSLAEAISLSVDRSCWPGWPIHLQTNVYTATITTTTTTTTTNQNINHRQYSSVQSIDIYIYICISVILSNLNLQTLADLQSSSCDSGDPKEASKLGPAACR